jgi:aspartate carbamoyltransferase catalytic subunit
MTWLEQPRRDVLSLHSFSRDDLLALFRFTDQLRALEPAERANLCRNRTLATVFFQPSTRTRLSLESAMLFVGGSYLAFGHPEMTKAAAGESLADTVRVVSGYADAIAVRHPRDDAATVSAAASEVPVVNAGSGTLEHPTQALLDLYAMHHFCGSIDGLTIGLFGDLRTQRTINSLIVGLSRFDVQLRLVSHPERALRAETAANLRPGTFTEHESLASVLPDLDVLYTIRIDRDRTLGAQHYEELRGDRVVTAHGLARARPGLVVLNPLPRDDELHPDVDGTPHARYFEQARLGRPLRGALLTMMLSGSEPRG